MLATPIVAAISNNRGLFTTIFFRQTSRTSIRLSRVDVHRKPQQRYIKFIK